MTCSRGTIALAAPREVRLSCIRVHGADAEGAKSYDQGETFMARVPYPKKEDLPEADRPVYERMERERGVGHIWLALANAPKILDPIMSLAGALRNDTVIEKRFRELGVVMVGLVSKSDYEFDHHWNAALAAGVRREQLENLKNFETAPMFDEQERAVLRYAKEATTAGAVSDATWGALRRHFDTRQAMEIVLTVAWYNCVVRILLPLQIEHEPGFKRL
jgi:alkylhydroperoxidase family enzyme